MQGWVRLKDCKEKCIEHSGCEAFLYHHARSGGMGPEYYDDYMEIMMLWCRIKYEKEGRIKRWIRDNFEFHFER